MNPLLFVLPRSRMLPVGVLVVDQLANVRDTLRKLVQSYPGWQVCAEVEDQIDIVDAVEHWHPKLLLIDVSEPVLNALETIRQIAEQHPEVRILATSVYVTAESAQQVRAAGGHGIIEKVDLTKEFDHVVQAFREGRTFFPMLAE